MNVEITKDYKWGAVLRESGQQHIQLLYKASQPIWGATNDYNMDLIGSYLKPKPELTSDPAGAALTGNTVTLTCRMDPSTGNWDSYWYKHTLNPETEKTETNSYSLKIDSVSDGGQYWCRAGRGKPVYYTQYSDALWVNVTVSPKAVVTVRPDERVFRGETVTLRCDIKWGGDTEWTYRWEIEGTNNQYKNTVSRTSTQELNISSVDLSHRGKYTCTGQIHTQSSQRSDAVTLTVSAEAQASVRVSPQPWLTEGESVTLICEVSGSSKGWTFSWFRDHDHLSDSSRGAGGSYTLSPAALQHTGVYTCRAERGRPAYYTHNSSSQTLWITGVSASVSLVINPSRSQHFSSDSLSLSCEDQSNSTGWTVRRYTDKDRQTCAKQTGSGCVMDSLSTSDTGVYWCESESGEKRRPRNITVHDGEVILESSVDPVIEGETLTLHCLHRSTNSPILSANFYKDGSLIQNQTTGEMSITTVSKSHEGFYYCKTERGQSLHSWISVRGEFVPKAESWSAYIERLELFFEANGIRQEKQVATLLSVMGATTYGLLRNLVQPEKPKDKSYKDIVDTLKNHFEPKPLLIAERFRFNHCNQRADETVTEYAAELKQCAVSCEFGATLDEALRDRFVSGIRNEACQRRLLSESNLTFARAFEIALSMETAEKDTQQLRGLDSRRV
ncbi:unnamed protein product [Leuciscus chuanchicus]